jgi:predicted MFS family arabinose efflux permease
MFSKKFNPWWVWAVVTFFYAYQYVLRVVPSVLISDITHKFSLSPEKFGQFSGVYYLGYSLAHVPIGAALDRIGPKRIVPIFILMTVAGLLPLIFAKIWIFPVLGRTLMGIGSSGAILSVFKVIRSVFDEKRFSQILSYSVTVGLIGAIYGGGPVHILRSHWGFEGVVASLVIIGLILCILAFYFIPNSQNSRRATSIIEDLSVVLGNREVVFLCILAGLMVGPLEGFADIWGAQFLKKYYGLEAGLAATLPSFIFLGMCFGGPILCYVAERRNRHFETVLASAVIMAGSFIAMLLVQIPTSVLTGLFLMVGVCCAYQILVIYKVSTLVGPELTGMASAVANMIIMIFGYVFHSVIGQIVGTLGGFEDTRALSIGIMVIPIALVMSIVGVTFYLFSKRTNLNGPQAALVTET